MLVLKALFWGSAGALAWTHAGYPLAAAALARVRPKVVRKGDQTPSVTLIVPAHDEEAVIAGRLENLLALDYPPEQLEIVVASDASSDRTDEIVEESPRASRGFASGAGLAAAAPALTRRSPRPTAKVSPH
jgi:cellulose synthase/poly-beta-1,6-N-acetylglucosamine synthase-like glycosyltransferase